MNAETKAREAHGASTSAGLTENTHNCGADIKRVQLTWTLSEGAGFSQQVYEEGLGATSPNISAPNAYPSMLVVFSPPERREP